MVKDIFQTHVPTCVLLLSNGKVEMYFNHFKWQSCRTWEDKGREGVGGWRADTKR